MKNLIILSMVFVVSVFFSSCSDNLNSAPEANQNNQSLLKGSGPSATGQGRMTGIDRVFAFNAVTHPDGSVSGQGQLTYTHNGNDVKINFSIDCMSVDGNKATMSGTVMNSNDFESGGPCYFKVIDNGKGGNAPPDEITGFLFCLPGDSDPLCAQLTCGNDLSLQYFTVENGNILVRQ